MAALCGGCREGCVCSWGAGGQREDSPGSGLLAGVPWARVLRGSVSQLQGLLGRKSRPCAPIPPRGAPSPPGRGWAGPGKRGRESKRPHQPQPRTPRSGASWLPSAHRSEAAPHSGLLARPPAAGALHLAPRCPLRTRSASPAQLAASPLKGPQRLLLRRKPALHPVWGLPRAQLVSPQAALLEGRAQPRQDPAPAGGLYSRGVLAAGSSPTPPRLRPCRPPQSGGPLAERWPRPAVPLRGSRRPSRFLSL